MLSFQGAERFELYTLGGNDSILSNDTAVTSVIDMGAGDDSLVVGTVPLIPDPGNRTLEYPNGVPVADTAHMTNGNTAPLYVLGGTQNDYFEVNHNVGMLYLAGDEGDDTFLVNTFLVLKQNPDKPDLVTNLTTLFGGQGSNRYQYLENAPVVINGGSGYDTLIIVGTPIDDTFIVTDTYIAGAGRLVSFMNIEAIEIDGAGGNDQIYVMSTDPDLTVTVNGGSGDDTIHIGGTPPPLVYAPPPYTYTPPAYTVTSLQIVQTTITNNYTTYTFHEDLLTWALLGGTGNANAAATLLLNQAFGITPGGIATATFAGLSVSYDWNVFDFFNLLPGVTVTLSGVQVSYQIPTIRFVSRQIQPPPVTITPAPVALMASPSLDASKVRSRVIILGGNDYETNGDTVVYENENGAARRHGGHARAARPAHHPAHDRDRRGPGDRHAAVRAGHGLGHAPAAHRHVSELRELRPRHQPERDDERREHAVLRPPDAGDRASPAPPLERRLEPPARGQLGLQRLDDDEPGLHAGRRPAGRADRRRLRRHRQRHVRRDGHRRRDERSPAAAAPTRRRSQAPSGDLSGILGRLTVDGDDLMTTQTTHVTNDGSDPEALLVSQFLGTSILVIPTGSSKGTDSAGHPYFEAAWVPILCVIQTQYCSDTSDPSAPAGSIDVRSAVIDSTGTLVTVDVQQKGTQIYAQQKYGYQVTDVYNLPYCAFSLSSFSFSCSSVQFRLPLFLNPDGSTTHNDTGVPDIVEADYGSSGAVPLYLDAAGNETTANTGLPALVLPGTSYSHVAGPSRGDLRQPGFQNVLDPWGPNLLDRRRLQPVGAEQRLREQLDEHEHRRQRRLANAAATTTSSSTRTARPRATRRSARR